MPGACRAELHREGLPIAHLSLLRRRSRILYGLAPELSPILSSLKSPNYSSYWRRRVQSNRIPRVGQRSLQAGCQPCPEWMVLILAREDVGNSCESWSEVRLQCRGRRCLLVRVGVFSRLSTGSSSHGHGGKLRFKIIHRLRNCYVLWKFSSFTSYLSVAKPVDNGEGSPPLVVYRDHEVDTIKHVVGVAQDHDRHPYWCLTFD